MRRFLRILLNAATAVSLLLCAATLAFWVRGYWVADMYYFRADPAKRVLAESGDVSRRRPAYAAFAPVGRVFSVRLAAERLSER